MYTAYICIHVCNCSANASAYTNSVFPIAVIIISAIVIVFTLSAVISGALLSVAFKRKKKTELMQ